mmetsp:Transcript_23276/g.34169  ORF Transcript_23276/g.34169 Transcript_23276/m.34169 type:complete len:415 (-) Transcript_23276:298-1542(-)|eukprot:CAMPEP_0185017178 /NCGR_PEP_ID=MMETSP1103-20130426/142_1 /TAXON_ID=36769 /ORGANISM="Paraphysomonas bandaiensis, Strain Caron Lab Isolate" /LENGTH=414 /DNA_ID=CAMNT_0027546463 /DNA_START=242 /DNA_END=1486 /DNA_ORIENTATION=+
MADVQTRFRSPSNDPSNGEVHFKRPRAGSISGRLRAASDLEESGFIDRFQKGLLKDKIIAGDPALQAALDKYDRGDASDLEAIIKSGGLTADTVDLLDGLDLDFLTVGKGGAFQNFDDMDFSFDSMDDIGFRMRGMSEIGLQGETGGVKREGEKQEDLQFSHGKGHVIPDTQAVNGNMACDPYSQTGPNSEIFSYDSLSVSPPQLNGSEFMFEGSRSRGMSNISDLDGPAYRSHGLSNLSDFDPFPGSKQNLTSTLGDQSQSTLSTRVSPPHQTSLNNVFATSTSSQNTLNKSSSSSHYLTPSNLAPMSDIPGYTMSAGMLIGDKRLQQSSQPTTMYSAQKPKPELEKGYIGAYSPENRKQRLEKFFEKRKKRVWTKKVKYDVRKNFADSRLRVKGRFVKKEDEEILRDLQNLE